MAEELNVSTYEQIASLLTILATNYSSISDLFFTVFYDPNPQNVTFKMLDESGHPQEYTVKNLALSNQYRITGEGVPERRVLGSKGTLYQDLTNGEVYVKQSLTGKEDWRLLVSKALLDGYIQQGTVDPNGFKDESGNWVGTIDAIPGTLYIDTSETVLYIRLNNPDPVTGRIWAQVTSSIEGFAKIDLSNITTEDSEFGISGATRIKNYAIEAIGTKTTVLDDMSTDEQYPTAKTVYEGLELKQDKANLVQSISGTSTHSQYPSAKCVYDMVTGVIPVNQKFKRISNGVVTLEDTYEAYYQKVQSNTTFSFDTANLSDTQQDTCLTFELIIDMPSAVSLIFPSNAVWQGGEIPYMGDTGLYMFVFRSFDKGTHWIGNLQGIWQATVQ